MTRLCFAVCVFVLPLVACSTGEIEVVANLPDGSSGATFDSSHVTLDASLGTSDDALVTRLDAHDAGPSGSHDATIPPSDALVGGGGMCGAVTGAGHSDGGTIRLLQVTPVCQTIALGTSLGFAAVLEYANGTTKNITSQVGWSSSNASVAVIAAASGLATGVGEGTALITASFEGISATASLKVEHATLLLPDAGPDAPFSCADDGGFVGVDSGQVIEVRVTPRCATAAPSTTVQYTATETLVDGTTMDITLEANWSFSDTSIATTSQDGLATAISPGTDTITATLGSVSASARLTVTGP